MFTEKDFEKEFARYLPLYFKDNFQGKTLTDAVYETLKKKCLC